MTRPVRILAVCSYNRVRSVMAEVLLRDQLQQEGIPAHVIGAGFAEADKQPVHDAVEALRAMGFDASGMRSTRVNARMVADADLVLTAERLHVVRLAEDDAAVLNKVYTLPEFARLAPAAGARGDAAIDDWLKVVGASRTHATFLTSHPPEIADPSGQPPAAFLAAAREIQAWCQVVARLL